MKARWLFIALCIALGSMFIIDRSVLWGQATDTRPRTMTITGPVAVVRTMGRNIVFELGGQWRRRFSAVIDEANVLIPLREVNRLYQDRIIQVSGPTYENRGRFEIQIDDLDQITVLDPNTHTVQPLPQPTLVSPPWPGDYTALAKEIKKLRRDVDRLKKEQLAQKQVIQQLQAKPKSRVEYRHRDNGYQDLDHRIHRIEVLLDSMVQAAR